MNFLRRLVKRKTEWNYAQEDAPLKHPYDYTPRPLTGKVQPVPEQWQLDYPLFAFSPIDFWTLGDACEGCQIFGGTGSGKTSGSGSTIASSFLENGFGGLVLCVKPEEADDWENRLLQAGRLKDMVRVSFEGPWRLNILDYEMRRKDKGGGKTENIVNLISTITEIAEDKRGGSSGDDFWPRAMREMLRNAVDLLKISGQTISFDNLTQLIRTAPTSPQQVSDPEANKTWRRGSFCALCLTQGGMKDKTDIEQHNFDISRRYWLHHYPNLGNRTRASIVATYTSIADQLQHDEAHLLLGTTTNFVPEMTYKDGAIIILDMSIQEYGELGRIAQGIIKYVYQRAILRRKVKKYPRPCFIWIDEAQAFVNPAIDYQFQAVARSARACTVYLTQNIRNYHAVFGSHGVAEADALLGNFQTKIFHANADAHTNQYAADLVAQDWSFLTNVSSSMNEMGTSRNAGSNQSLQYKVLPVEFTRLKKGGLANDLQVEGIVFQGGRIWQASEDTFIKAIFTQPPRD